MKLIKPDWKLEQIIRSMSILALKDLHTIPVPDLMQLSDSLKPGSYGAKIL